MVVAVVRLCYPGLEMYFSQSVPEPVDPDGLRDHMAAVSRFLVNAQPLTPVTGVAGLSAADWRRHVLVHGYG